MLRLGLVSFFDSLISQKLFVSLLEIKFDFFCFPSVFPLFSCESITFELFPLGINNHLRDIFFGTDHFPDRWR